MQHISSVTKPLLASIALRSFMFWAHRCKVLERGETTQAERDVAARNRDAFAAQWQMLRGRVS